MKANMIRTAIVTLAVVISTSVSAQNTKSYSENNVATKLSKIVKENITRELNNLKAAIQFKPEANFEYTGEAIETLAVDLSELECMVKYTPSSLPDYFEAETGNDFANVLKELETVVKYQPQSDVSENSLEDIVNELAITVRYSPAS